MKLRLVYDDANEVPEIAALTGVARLGSLRYRKRLLWEHVQGFAAAAGAEAIRLCTQADLRSLHSELNEWGSPQRYIYWPSATMVGDHEHATLFFKRIRYIDQNATMVSTETGRPFLAILGADLMRRFLAGGLLQGMPNFFSDHRESFQALRDDLRCVDLSRYDSVVRFLSSNFDARFFNQLSGDEYVVTKRSTDTDKLRREFEFYDLLPRAMQTHFVRPFDYQEADGVASYRMERLAVPDMAIQWIHGALNEAEFEQYIDRVFQFIASRPFIDAPADRLQAEAQDVYLDKVARRLEAFAQVECFSGADALLKSASAFGGVDDLFQEYRALYGTIQRDFVGDHLCISHGDLCFSNMLYDKRLRLLRLVDPRGARTKEQLFLDRYYDVAKLSHSVLGGYDFLNNDAFEIQIDLDLKAKLVISGADPAEKKRIFVDRLEAHGFHYPLVRLYELSLFLSMLPLHQDVPKKVLGFLLNAVDIAQELRRHVASKPSVVKRLAA